MPTAYIICDNDSTEHVVIGKGVDPVADDAYAEKVKKKLVDKEIELHKQRYGKNWESNFGMHFFHIHRVTCEEAP